MGAHDDDQARRPIIGQGAVDPKKLHRRRTDAIVSIVLPWLIFFLILSVFMFAYHEAKVLVWLLVGVCACLALLFLFLGIVARHATLLAIAVLSMTSVITASSVGLWVHTEYLNRYWDLDGGQEYQGVDPTSNGSATSDGTIIGFMNGTFVDDFRTIGFIRRGDIWCVAPVVRPGRYPTQISYWAVGQNCCDKRSNFECGTARLHGRLAGLVSQRHEEYDKAVDEARSVYGGSLAAAENVQYIDFVADPKDAVASIWADALSIAILACLLDLLLNLCAGLLVALVIVRKPMLGVPLASQVTYGGNAPGSPGHASLNSRQN